jgi:hypothetical protein
MSCGKTVAACRCTEATGSPSGVGGVWLCSKDERKACQSDVVQVGILDDEIYKDAWASNESRRVLNPKYPVLVRETQEFSQRHPSVFQTRLSTLHLGRDVLSLHCVSK